ncbi:MAG: ABC transporter ATP-binding protein, partial [Desulfobacula sp.]|nr:ABC transporter ATP-binding protein [Desulfobacula sp.]
VLGRNLTIADRKKLEIARGLATSPKIFLLDEVMAGLNESELLEMKKLIRNIADSGITLLIIEHIMTVIMELSQKVIVLDQGKFLTSGTPEQVTKNPEVIKAYLGKEFKHA